MSAVELREHCATSTATGASSANPMMSETAYGQCKASLNQRHVSYNSQTRYGVKYEFLDHKITNYGLTGQFGLFWALTTVPHTILARWQTWKHILQLILIGLTAAFVTLLCGFQQSIETYGVQTEIKTLLSFVLAGYVGICLTRWSTVGYTNLGLIITNMENASFNKNYVFVGDSDLEVKLSNMVDRYCRLVVQLVFMSAQKEADLQRLVKMQLLIGKEVDWVAAATVDSRAHLVLSWMHQIFVVHKDEFKIDMFSINYTVSNSRTAILGLQSYLNNKLPFTYVHMLYWTTHLLLMAMACETGVSLAVDSSRQKNGNGDYDDDLGSWPKNPKIWYQNAVLNLLVSQALFALFVEGLLTVCNMVQNPLDRHVTCISEHLVGKISTAKTAAAAASTATDANYAKHL